MTPKSKFDGIIRFFHEVLQKLPDKPTGKNRRYGMEDAAGASHFCNEYKYSNAKLSFFRYQSLTNLASESQFENPIYAKNPDM